MGCRVSFESCLDLFFNRQAAQGPILHARHNLLCLLLGEGLETSLTTFASHRESAHQTHTLHE